MKVAAFGRTQWLHNSIRAVRDRGHEVVLIGTCTAAPEYTADAEDFGRLAQEIGCPFFSNAAINRPEYIAMARDSAAEAAICVNWLTLVGQQMIDQFRFGAINAHAGDLPRFRGNAPINWAILQNEPKVVLTLHQMDVQLDHGPILLQREYPLTPHTYVVDVYRFLDENIPSMFAEVIDGLAASVIAPRPQAADPALSLRCYPRLPWDGEINWQLPASALDALVRASAEPFPGAYTYHNGEKVIVWRAHAESPAFAFYGTPGQVAEVRKQNGEVAVVTGQGLLVLETVGSPDGPVPAAQRFSSARIRFGMDYAAEILRLKERLARLEQQP